MAIVESVSVQIRNKVDHSPYSQIYVPIEATKSPFANEMLRVAKSSKNSIKERLQFIYTATDSLSVKLNDDGTLEPLYLFETTQGLRRLQKGIEDGMVALGQEIYDAAGAEGAVGTATPVYSNPDRGGQPWLITASGDSYFLLMKNNIEPNRFFKIDISGVVKNQPLLIKSIFVDYYALKLAQQTVSELLTERLLDPRTETIEASTITMSSEPVIYIPNSLQATESDGVDGQLQPNLRDVQEFVPVAGDGDGHKKRLTTTGVALKAEVKTDTAEFVVVALGSTDRNTYDKTLSPTFRRLAEDDFEEGVLQDLVTATWWLNGLPIQIEGFADEIDDKKHRAAIARNNDATRFAEKIMHLNTQRHVKHIRGISVDDGLHLAMVAIDGNEILLEDYLDSLDTYPPEGITDKHVSRLRQIKRALSVKMNFTTREIDLIKEGVIGKVVHMRFEDVFSKSEINSLNSNLAGFLPSELSKLRSYAFGRYPKDSSANYLVMLSIAFLARSGLVKIDTPYRQEIFARYLEMDPRDFAFISELLSEKVT